jgi:hypothetical protein
VYRQRPEDRILAALVRKTDTIKKELGSLSQVIEGKLADTLVKQGIRRTLLDKLEQEIDSASLDPATLAVVEEELDAARDRQKTLREQIDTLRNRLNDSRKWVGLQEEDFRQALSCALELLGGGALQPLAEQPHAYALPELHEQATDARWAETLDSLRPPRERGQKLWEWRKEAPLRPLVFADPGTMTDDVVHLHLEHPLVRRLLGRFTAQGFVLDDISRGCFVQTTDALPRVILLGRLCLYGLGAARLHEEIVAVTARWIDPAQRKEPLKPYAREAEANTLQLLDAALRQSQQPANDVVLQRLQASASRDVEELRPHLEERGTAIVADAMQKLAKRGNDEAKAMREILEAQKKRINDEIKKNRKDTQGQGLLDWFEEERKQLEADIIHWGKRLSDIDAELESEPARIRETYTVKAQRIEPVGIVYLWPITG